MTSRSFGDGFLPTPVNRIGHFELTGSGLLFAANSYYVVRAPSTIWLLRLPFSLSLDYAPEEGGHSLFENKPKIRPF